MDGYKREKLIGQGTFGTVWLVKSSFSQMNYVLKAINLTKMDEKEQQRALTEVTILSRCRHKNIIAYKDSSIDKQMGTLCILMEYANGGDLLTAITNQNGVPFQECTVITWFIEISLALQYIHYNNILHRDLKCKNIFLSKRNVIKVGDFGIARILERSEDLATTKIGTPYYLSPEICSQQPYNCKTDMWALGCILFEMSALVRPFEAKNFRQLITTILGEKRRDLPSWSGPVVRELVEELLQLDPVKRPSADEILAKPSLQPYLIFTSSKIPSLVAGTFRKEENHQKTFKRSSEKNYSLEVNKARFTSTGKLHFHQNSSKDYQLDFKITKKSSGNCNKIPTHPDLRKDNKRSKPLNTTYIVLSSPQNKEEFQLKTQNGEDCRIHQTKYLSSSVVKPKQSRCFTEFSTERSPKKVSFQVSCETKLSPSIPRICEPKSPCQHSQCHQCMIDMLWKNRIHGCGTTTLNNEEYYELEKKLWSIFKEDKFDKIYNSLLNDWNDIEILEISSKNYTQSLTYEQLQHLPLMMQLIQLDMLKSPCAEKTF